MKELLTEWRKFLKQNLNILQEEEELGKYAFADQRIIPHQPEERDNELEIKLFSILKNHFKDNIKLPKDIAELISNFIKNNQYQDIFSYPKDKKYVYRGLALSQQDLKKISDKISPDFITNLQNTDDYVSETFQQPFKFEKIDLTLKNIENNFVSSWTDELESAIIFSSAYPESLNYSVIFVAEVLLNKDKLIDSQPLYKLKEI
jgi:hypothetical protein